MLKYMYKIKKDRYLTVERIYLTLTLQKLSNT